LAQARHDGLYPREKGLRAEGTRGRGDNYTLLVVRLLVVSQRYTEEREASTGFLTSIYPSHSSE
jgi:hypothetical protein